MTEIKEGVCPICEAMRPIENGVRKETVPVRGEEIEIDAEYSRCTVCGQEFADAESMERSLQAAYDVYRQRFALILGIRRAHDQLL